MRFWSTIVAVLILDQLSKLWVLQHLQVGESWTLIPGVLDLTHARNVGAAFSLLEGQIWLFVIIAIGVVAGAVIYMYLNKVPNWEQYSLGFIVGGAMGNVIDRLAYGSVVDFFSIGWWPVFNFADMAIISGGVLLMIYILKTEEPA